MATKTTTNGTTKTTTKPDPFKGLTAEDMKVVGRMESATLKVEKASEALNRVLAEAESKGLHVRAGYTNFGRWAVDAMESRGIRLSKSRVYNAVKIGEVRAAAPDAEKLSDTVCLRIAEAAPMGDAEKVAAFVAEVVESGGTVAAVKTVAGSDDVKTNPEDAAAESIAEKLWKVCKGDVKGAEAIMAAALATYKAHALSQVQTTK